MSYATQLQTSGNQVSHPGSGKWLFPFLKPAENFWAPSSFLCSGYRGSLLRVKHEGRDIYQSPPTSTKKKGKGKGRLWVLQHCCLEAYCTLTRMSSLVGKYSFVNRTITNWNQLPVMSCAIVFLLLLCFSVICVVLLLLCCSMY